MSGESKNDKARDKSIKILHFEKKRKNIKNWKQGMRFTDVIESMYNAEFSEGAEEDGLKCLLSQK